MVAAAYTGSNMRFEMPNYPCEFQIPDEWIKEAEAKTLNRTTSAYTSTPSANLTPLSQIEPPGRSRSCQRDHSGFDRARMVSILKGILAGDVIEPVTVRKILSDEFPMPVYQYRVCDGFHRYYASIVVGFDNLPTAIT